MPNIPTIRHRSTACVERTRTPVQKTKDQQHHWIFPQIASLKPPDTWVAAVLFCVLSRKMRHRVSAPGRLCWRQWRLHALALPRCSRFIMMAYALLQSLRPALQGQEALNSQTVSLAHATALQAAMHLLAASILMASLSAAFVAASILVASLVTLLEAMAT